MKFSKKCSSEAKEDARGASPIIAKYEFYNSSKSVENLKGGGGGGKLHISPTLVAGWFLDVKKIQELNFCTNK